MFTGINYNCFVRRDNVNSIHVGTYYRSNKTQLQSAHDSSISRLIVLNYADYSRVKILKVTPSGNTTVMAAFTTRAHGPCMALRPYSGVFRLEILCRATRTNITSQKKSRLTARCESITVRLGDTLIRSSGERFD